MKKSRVTSGIGYLDQLLDGLHIGDNVVWYDESGSLASIFCLNLIQSSLDHNKSVIYVSFDRSPRNLLEKLGPLAQSPSLTILDCFSCGKGASSPLFLQFYDEIEDLPCHIVRVREPGRIDGVMDVLYGIHASLEGDVRLVFESLTGMQELWGSEDTLIKFYVHSCPRLYDLNTIAYWLMEKRAHSPRLRAQINQVAQVVIELSIRRGTTSLSVLKAEKRGSENLHRPCSYWTRDLVVTFDEEKRTSGGVDIGQRLKEWRTKRGISQTELAKLVGVTPSAVSQVESNLIYPSLPALMKMAEALEVSVGSFFQDQNESRKRAVFSSSEAAEIKFPAFIEGSIFSKMLVPIDMRLKVEPYLIEIPPEQVLPAHFFTHRGEEIGYLLSGELQVKIGNEVHMLRPGDLICLTEDSPTHWKNTGPSPAKLLWIKVRH